MAERASVDVENKQILHALYVHYCRLPPEDDGLTITKFEQFLRECEIYNSRIAFPQSTMIFLQCTRKHKTSLLSYHAFLRACGRVAKLWKHPETSRVDWLAQKTRLRRKFTSRTQKARSDQATPLKTLKNSTSSLTVESKTTQQSHCVPSVTVTQNNPKKNNPKNSREDADETPRKQHKSRLPAGEVVVLSTFSQFCRYALWKCPAEFARDMMQELEHQSRVNMPRLAYIESSHKTVPSSFDDQETSMYSTPSSHHRAERDRRLMAMSAPHLAYPMSTDYEQILPKTGRFSERVLPLQMSDSNDDSNHALNMSGANSSSAPPQPPDSPSQVRTPRHTPPSTPQRAPTNQTAQSGISSYEAQLVRGGAHNLDECMKRGVNSPAALASIARLTNTSQYTGMYKQRLTDRRVSPENQRCKWQCGLRGPGTYLLCVHCGVAFCSVCLHSEAGLMVSTAKCAQCKKPPAHQKFVRVSQRKLRMKLLRDKVVHSDAYTHAQTQVSLGQTHDDTKAHTTNTPPSSHHHTPNNGSAEGKSLIHRLDSPRFKAEVHKLMPHIATRRRKGPLGTPQLVQELINARKHIKSGKERKKKKTRTSRGPSDSEPVRSAGGALRHAPSNVGGGVDGLFYASTRDKSESRSGSAVRHPPADVGDLTQYASDDGSRKPERRADSLPPCLSYEQFISVMLDLYQQAVLIHDIRHNGLCEGAWMRFWAIHGVFQTFDPKTHAFPAQTLSRRTVRQIFRHFAAERKQFEPKGRQKHTQSHPRARENGLIEYDRSGDGSSIAPKRVPVLSFEQFSQAVKTVALRRYGAHTNNENEATSILLLAEMEIGIVRATAGGDTASGAKQDKGSKTDGSKSGSRGRSEGKHGSGADSTTGNTQTQTQTTPGTNADKSQETDEDARNMRDHAQGEVVISTTPALIRAGSSNSNHPPTLPRNHGKDELSVALRGEDSAYSTSTQHTQRQTTKDGDANGRRSHYGRLSVDIKGKGGAASLHSRTNYFTVEADGTQVRHITGTLLNPLNWPAEGEKWVYKHQGRVTKGGSWRAEELMSDPKPSVTLAQGLTVIGGIEGVLSPTPLRRGGRRFGALWRPGTHVQTILKRLSHMNSYRYMKNLMRGLTSPRRRVLGRRNKKNAAEDAGGEGGELTLEAVLPGLQLESSPLTVVTSANRRAPHIFRWNDYE